jgi:hypothetical protein
MLLLDKLTNLIQQKDVVGSKTNIIIIINNNNNSDHDNSVIYVLFTHIGMSGPNIPSL